jgi:hypothetical protein
MAKGVQISDRVDVQAILQTAITPAAGFGKNLFMVDSDEIPVDLGVVSVTKSDFADYFDEAGVVYQYCLSHFSQKRIPASLLLGRYVPVIGSPSAAEAVSVFRDYETDVAVWEAIDDGSLAVDMNGSTPVDITGIDFTGVTSLEQVWAIITAEIQAYGMPVSSGILKIDNFGRLVFSVPGVLIGAGNVTGLIAVTPGTGTDISAMLGTAVNNHGVDGGTAGAELDRLLSINNSAYFITLKTAGTTTAAIAAEALSFCARIESLEKIGGVVVADANIKDPANTTNIFEVLKSAGYKRSFGIYFENITARPTVCPDAASLGCVIPAAEGTTKFAQEQLVIGGVSGYAAPLTKAETDAVIDHGGNVIERVGEVNYMFPGLTFGGEEIRIMLGRDWFVTRIREDIFNYTIQQPLTAFDNETLTAIAGFIRNRGEQAIARRIIVNTVERPFLINMPDEDDFTAAERASHKMEAFDVFQAYLNSAVNEYKLVGTWSI